MISNRVRDLERELLYALPSKRMSDVCSAVGFINPYDNNKLIIAKTRYDKLVTDNFTVDDFEIYDNLECKYYDNMNHDYNELIGKLIIFDNKILNRRGRETLKELADLNKP